MPCELKLLLADVEEYRQRLSHISWMIRLASQRVARRSNAEDDVDGRFFAKRFESDRLETEADVLACSLSVDLNWIHAGMADTPEQSHYTSAADRIRARWRAMAIEFGGEPGTKMSEFPPDDDWLAPIFLDERAEAYVGPHTPVESPESTPAERLASEGDPIVGAAAEGDGAAAARSGAPPVSRLPFSNPIGAARVSNKGFLPITLDDYLQLLDAAGRVVRPDKRGKIPQEIPPILERLNLQPKRWIESILEFFGSRSAYRPCPLVLRPG